MNGMIGRTLGKYQIVEQLGEGGMATVYKAFDSSLERYVAIKVIRMANQVDPYFLARFQREAKALAQLDHPYILKVLDYGEKKGMPYLVMPFIAHGTLKQYTHSPVPYEKAIKIVLPIAEALSYAHKRKIIHRDVKPANILFGESGEPILSDFGIAKILDTGGEQTQLTGVGLGIGTPAYMAPEQWNGIADERSDIYSLGIVLYELLTSRCPFQADTPAAILIKQVQDPLPRPKSFVTDIPENVEAVIFKALAKDPTMRFQTMQDFINAMFIVLQDKTTAFIVSPSISKELEVTQVAYRSPKITPVPMVVDKKPAQKRKWILFVKVGGVLITIGCIILLIASISKNGFLNLKKTTEVVGAITQETIVNNNQESTQIGLGITETQSEPTSTPIPAWVLEANTLADPILSAIEYQPPDFEDDFSTIDPRWISDPDKMSCTNLVEGKPQIKEGRLTFGIYPDCFFRTVVHPNLVYGNFVVQMDLDFQDAGDFNWSTFMWPVNPPEEGSYQAFGLYLTPTFWRIEVADLPSRNIQDVRSGGTQVDNNKPVSFTVIHQDMTFLYYLDSVLVASYTHEANADGPLQIRLGLEDFSENFTGEKTVAVDNVRAWDLDEVFLPERILAAIRDREPDFEDDFSNALAPSWKYYLEADQLYKCPDLDDAAMTIVEDEMQLRIGPGCRDNTLAFKEAGFSTNYVLQMDIDFQQAPHVNFGIEPGDATLALDIQGSGLWNLGGSEENNGQFNSGQPLSVTMILYGDTQWIYLDSTLVASQSNLPAFSEPLNLYFHIYKSEDLELSDLESVALDNIRIWDVNKLLIP